MFTLVSAHVIDTIFKNMGHGEMVHLWIVFSNMSRAVRMVSMGITESFSLEVGNLINNMLFTTQMVDEEVHTMLAVSASYKPLILWWHITCFQHLTEHVRLLNNKLVKNSRKPAMNIVTSFTGLCWILTETTIEHCFSAVSIGFKEVWKSGHSIRAFFTVHT